MKENNSSDEENSNDSQNNNKNNISNSKDINTNLKSNDIINEKISLNTNKQDDNIDKREDSVLYYLNEKEFEEKNKDEREALIPQKQEKLSNVSNDDEEDSNYNLKNLEDIKLGSKIICPEDDCFLEPIIFLESNYFEINYDCGKHQNKMDIMKFVKNSSQKEELIECSSCNKKYKTIIEENEKFFICLCGQTFCEACKNKHLSNKKKEEHIMVDYDKKDYICFCSKYLKKYIGFCLRCNKNFCILCKKEHKKHNNKDFTSLYKLGEIQKKNFKDKIKEQKELIQKFITIVDNWLERTKTFFDIYKKKLQLYWEINNNIFSHYSVANNYYNEIKNIENIRFDFGENITNLIKAENDFKLQNQIILKILNENIRYKEENNIKKEKIPKLNLIQKDNELNGNVMHICELKKEELLVLNIKENKKQELHVYKIDKKEKGNFKPHIFSVVEDGEIISLSELKNGHLLMAQKKCFKIIGITKTKTEINIIQKEKLLFINQIIELINGNLITNSSNKNNIYSVSFWEKNQVSDSYENTKVNILGESPHMAISLLEINKDSFLILNKEGSDIEQNTYLFLDIYRFNQKENAKEKLNVSHCLRFKIESKFIKMIKYDEENIICLFEKGANTINLISEQKSDLYDLRIKNDNIYKNIEPNSITTILFDICKVPNSKNYFLVSFKEISKKDITCGVKMLQFDLFSHEIRAIDYIYKSKIDISIRCLFPLSNDIILMGSDKKIELIYG